MTKIWVYPPVEEWVREFLLPDLGAIPIVVQVPEQRPETFVTLIRGGGTDATLVTDAAHIIVDTWSASAVQAELLALKVRALLSKAPNHEVKGHWCTKYELMGGPVFMPDPDTQVPRYRMNILLHLRGKHVDSDL